VGLAVSGCVPVRPLLFNGQPWPVDANGKYLEGTARVLVELDYAGKVVGDCIDKSSGQPVLDELALRRAERVTYTPAYYQGWPMGSYARLPVLFSLDPNQRGAGTPTEQVKGSPACKVVPLPGRDPDQELTIRPADDATIPDSHPPIAWPVGSDGHPAQADVQMMALVDPSGVIVDAVVRGKGAYEALDKDAYRRAFRMHVAPGVQRWEFLHVHYRADGGGEVSEGRLGGTSIHLPPLPGGVRVFRDPHGMFVHGGAWPRAKSGLYLHAIVLVEAFVNTEGGVGNVRLKRGSGVAPFDERALLEVRYRHFVAPLQAHWMTIPVEFVPIVDPQRAQQDYAPPSHY